MRTRPKGWAPFEPALIAFLVSAVIAFLCAFAVSGPALALDGGFDAQQRVVSDGGGEAVKGCERLGLVGGERLEIC